MPRIVLDTSAINALEDNGAASAPLMRTLAWEFEVFLTFTNLEELIATPRAWQRQALVNRFERLLRSGKCIAPPDEIIRLMVSSHANGPGRFDWKSVDVFLSPELERKVLLRDYLYDEFCEGQKLQSRKIGNEFKRVLKSVRPALAEIPFQERPGSFAELAASDAVGGRTIWKDVGSLYQTLSGTLLTQEAVNKFVAACPPLRAHAMGTLRGFYGWSLQAEKGSKKEPAGRNDLAMAAYLPYCDYFVTNDCPQQKALSDVAREAALPCHVLRFSEFQRMC